VKPKATSSAMRHGQYWVTTVSCVLFEKDVTVLVTDDKD